MSAKKRGFVIFTFLFIIIFILFSIGGSGLSSYKQESYTWDFANSSNYIFNSSQINFTSGSIKLARIPLNYQWQAISNYPSKIISAIRDEDHNDTSKVISLDGTRSTIDEDDELRIRFNHTLNNSNIISIYLSDMSKEASISICSIDVLCNSTNSNHGFFTTNITGDLSFNISLINLTTASDEFDIRTNDTTKINYITSFYSVPATYNATNYSYSNNSISTNDLNTTNIRLLDSLAMNETLNNQAITYSYSTDSGMNWISISSYNLSYVNASNNKIRFNASLLTNTTETPIIGSMSLSYFIGCQENWSCSSWSLCNNNLKARTCLETSNCLAPQDMPAETGICGDFRRNISQSSMELSIITSQNVSNISLTPSVYGNISRHTRRMLKIKSMDLELDQNIRNALVNITLRYNYNTTELESSKTNISLLSFYFYNTTLASWEMVPTRINLSGSYIITNLTHFSTYGVFGNASNSQPNLSISNQTINEDMQAAINLSQYSSDADNDTLTYNATSQDASKVVCSITNSSNLTLVPAQNFNGISSCSATANDSESYSEPAVFYITVLPVNDAPIITSMASSIEMRSDETLILNLSTNATDVDSYSFNWSLSANNIINFSVDNLTSIMTIIPLAAGTTSINVTVNDDEYAIDTKSNITLTITQAASQSGGSSGSSSGGGSSSNSKGKSSQGASNSPSNTNNNEEQAANKPIKQSTENIVQGTANTETVKQSEKENQNMPQIPLTGRGITNIISKDNLPTLITILALVIPIAYYLVHIARKQKIFKFKKRIKKK